MNFALVSEQFCRYVAKNRHLYLLMISKLAIGYNQNVRHEHIMTITTALLELTRSINENL